jgi:hypothetical protein
MAAESYSFSPQFATIRSESPLAGMRPVASIQHTALSFKEDKPFQIRSSGEELVGLGAIEGVNKGVGAALQGITTAYVSARDAKAKKEKEDLDRGAAERIANIRAKGSKTDEEKKYEEEYKDARLKVLKKQLGKEDKDEPIDYGTLDDPDAAAGEDLDNLAPSGQEMWNLPSTDLQAEPIDWSLSDIPLAEQTSIGPTPQEVQNLWSKPLSELTAATPAGAGQAAQLAATQAGQIPVPSQDMSTDVQAQVRPLTPAYDLTAKYKGLVTPEQAQGLREQFYKATGEQMTGLGQPSLANMPTPVAQARKESPQAATQNLSNYLRTWADPDVAAKAQQKINEIMGSSYAPAEIEEITTGSGERGFKVKYPKKLTAKEIQDIKKSEGTGIDFDTEKKLRDEFVTQSKDYKTIQSAWRSIRTSGSEASAAGDMSLIFGFMKLLDPSSTVREGEYANAQNAAGVPDRVAAAYNKAINGQILADAQRKDFLNQAKKQYDSRLGEHNQIKKEFTRLAKEYNVEPKRVVLEFSMPEEVSSTENLAQQVQSKIKELQSYPANSEQRLKAASELNALRQQLTGSK